MLWWEWLAVVAAPVVALAHCQMLKALSMQRFRVFSLIIGVVVGLSGTAYFGSQHLFWPMLSAILVLTVYGEDLRPTSKGKTAP